MAHLLRRIARAFQFGYQAIDSTPRRKAPINVLRNEDGELLQTQRSQLVSTTRDLLRNFAAAKFALNKHLDYTSTFHFQSRTGEDALDRRIENLMAWWSNPRNCDLTGRHDFSRLTRMIESCATVDGDVWVLKLANGRIQVIEGDRVRTPPELGEVPIPAGGMIINGAVVDESGKLVGIAICKRMVLNAFGQSAGFIFDRYVPAEFILQHGYFWRYDQVRGVSPFAVGLNSFKDVMEASEYALIKAKIVSLVGLKFTRADGNEAFPTSAYGEGTGQDASKNTYNVDFGQMPYVLDMNPGDTAEVVESQHPSTQFQEYMRMMLSCALKSLDIPMCFYDEAYTNYSGMRQAWVAYQQSAQVKQRNLVRLLDDITFWKLATWIAAGLVTLPKGLTIYDLKWEWVGSGVPWIDPLKEASADQMAINCGLTSRQRQCKERGDDWFSIVNELAQENTIMKSLGVNPINTPLDGALLNEDKANAA